MNILVLNGSPRPNGNTSALVEAFTEGAKEAGHRVTVIQVGGKKIAGCLGCEYCHSRGNGACIQNDDMKEVYDALKEAEMLVLASPVYYYTFSGQLQCTIHRTYAIGVPAKLKKAALILSSESDGVYEASARQYQDAVIDYMELENAGILTANGSQNKSDAKRKELREFGRNL